MEINFLQTKLSDLTIDNGLRFDYKYYDFVLKQRFNLVADVKCVISLRNILQSDYRKFNYEDEVEYKGLPTGAEYYNENGDIITTQLVTKDEHPDRICLKINKGNILISSLKGAKAPVLYFDFEPKEYVASNGFYIFRVKNSYWDEKFVWYLLRTSLIRKILDDHLASGIGISSFKEKDLLRIKVPMIPLEIQRKTLEKIAPLQQKINTAYSKIESLQDIIDDVFEKYELKTKNKKRFEIESLLISLNDICNSFYLRSSSLYNIFWKKYGGCLLEQKKFSEIQLRDLIKPNIKRITKGQLEKSMILLEFQDIEPYSGRILNFNYVDEIGSDKIFLTGNDIIISKMNNHLGYVFILPKTQQDTIIGSSEFIPYLIKNKNIVSPEFIKYVLLTNDFLHASTFLRSGKSQSHPRIHIKDLLAIKIPLPDLRIQQKIVSEIQEREEKNNQYKEQIKKLREEIDNLIFETLK